MGKRKENTMLNIQVTEDYKLTSDGTQIIIQRKQIIDPTQSPAFDPEKHSTEKRIEWKSWKYCSKVEQAIEVILRQRILETDATNLKDLKNEIKSFRDYVANELN